MSHSAHRCFSVLFSGSYAKPLILTGNSYLIETIARPKPGFSQSLVREPNGIVFRGQPYTHNDERAKFQPSKNLRVRVSEGLAVDRRKGRRSGILSTCSFL
jgi:hypothetical protein